MEKHVQSLFLVFVSWLLAFFIFSFNQTAISPSVDNPSPPSNPIFPTLERFPYPTSLLFAVPLDRRKLETTETSTLTTAEKVETTTKVQTEHESTINLKDSESDDSPDTVEDEVIFLEVVNQEDTLVTDSVPTIAEISTEVITTPTQDDFPREEEDAEIPLVLCSDGSDGFQGLMALLLSISENVKDETLQRLQVYIVTEKYKEDEFEARFKCHFPDNIPFRYDVFIFDEEMIQAPITVKNEREQRLKSTLNFARFYYHKILPKKVKKMIHIDHDCIVMQDIADLFDRSRLNNENVLLEAVPREKPNYGSYFRFSKNEHVKNNFLREKPTFNAGVFTMNLEAWRNTNLTEQVEFWMKENAKEPFYEFGTNPLMLLVFYNKWKNLDAKWNVAGLAYRFVSKTIIMDASILHWSGIPKPWEAAGLGRYHKIWTKYHKSECFEGEDK